MYEIAVNLILFHITKVLVNKYADVQLFFYLIHGDSGSWTSLKGSWMCAFFNLFFAKSVFWKNE